MKFAGRNCQQHNMTWVKNANKLPGRKKKCTVAHVAY
uniref:Uncharacterized protein n=1 Tax=Rhizophora mucronata TaxID=61149 RepID=A0A2P2NN33_RHIMU